MNEKEMLEISFEQEQNFTKEFGSDIPYSNENRVPLKKPRLNKGYDKRIADRKVMESYRTRLASALINDGVDCEYLLQHSEMKTVFMNMVNDIIIQKEVAFKIQGLTNRLATVDLASFCKAGESAHKLFPVINQYKSHNLVKTYYIATTIGQDGVLEHRLAEVPVMESPILLV